MMVTLAFSLPEPVDPLLTTLFGLLCSLLGAIAALVIVDLQHGQARRRTRTPGPPPSLAVDRAYLSQRARDFAHAQDRPEMADVLTQFLVHTARRAERLQRRWQSQVFMQRSPWWRRRLWWQ